MHVFRLLTAPAAVSVLFTLVLVLAAGAQTPVPEPTTAPVPPVAPPNDSIPVFAPPNGSIPVFEGDEVTVPGRRPQSAVTTPAYVTVIGREELERMGFVTLGDALQFVSEAYVRASGGLLQISIRGSTPQQVLVLIDGVPLNSIAQLGAKLDAITLGDVERIEILRGPFSAIHGSGALGGVVQVVTRAAAGREASGTIGTHSTGGATVRLGGRLPSGLMFGLGTQYHATAGFRPNADLRRWTATGQIAVGDGPEPAWRLLVRSTWGDAGLPGSTVFPTPMDRLDDAQTLVHLAWTRRENQGGRRLVRAWWLEDRVDFRSPGFDTFNRGRAYGLEGQQVLVLGEQRLLTLGAEWQQAAVSSTSAFASFDGQASTAAGYLQYDARVAPRTLLAAGARYDLHSTYGTQLNPRLGFVHFAGQGLRIRGGLGRTFRGPSFTELHFPGCSNPNLLPEHAWAADLGLEAAVRPGLVVRLNGFYTDAANLIIGGCAPLNVGSARVMGFSIEAAGRLGEAWSVNGSFSWMEGLDRATGQRLLRLPHRQAALILRRAFGPGRSLSLVGQHVSERDDLDFSTFPAARTTLPGYATAGLRYEHRLGAWIIRAGIDNLFDARYETLHGYPAPGRTLVIQVGAGF